MKLNLDDLERQARDLEARDTMVQQDPAVTLALVARIRELEALGAEAADAMEASAADHSQCDDHTDDLQFKAAQRWRGTLGKGVVLPDGHGPYQPAIGDDVEPVARTGVKGFIVRNQGGSLPWVVRYPTGSEVGYAAHELRPASP